MLCIPDVSVVFTDVVSSTRLYQELGDRVASGLISQHLRDVSTTIHDGGGLVIKYTGDGLVALFEDPLDALDAVWSTLLYTELPIRSSIHRGSALCRHDEFYGMSIHVAARLIEHAEPGECVSSLLIDRRREQLTIRGVQEPLLVSRFTACRI